MKVPVKLHPGFTQMKIGKTTLSEIKNEEVFHSQEFFIVTFEP